MVEAQRGFVAKDLLLEMELWRGRGASRGSTAESRKAEGGSVAGLRGCRGLAGQC